MRLPALDSLSTRFMLMFVFLSTIPWLSSLAFMLSLIESDTLGMTNRQWGVSMGPFVHHFLEGMQAILIASAGISAIFGVAVSRRLVAPLNQVIQRLNSLSLSRHPQPLLDDLQSVDRHVYEIRHLCEAFDGLASRIQRDMQTRDAFVATLTHDLKVPLLATRQTLDYMHTHTYGELSTTQQEVVAALKSANQTCLTLVNALLDVSRYDAGQIRLLKQPLSLPTVLLDVLREYAPLALQKHVQLRLCLPEGISWAATDMMQPQGGLPHPPPPLPNLITLADPIELKRAVRNLLDNALTYTPVAGAITLCVQTLPLAGNGPSQERLSPLAYSSWPLDTPLPLCDNHYLVALQDSGEGFSGSELAHVFARFTRSTRHPMSTGLGLHNAAQVIQGHGGHIWIESEPGQGTCVYWTLPVASPSLQNAPLPQSNPEECVDVLPDARPTYC
jgi:signal transduction histidine kinase